MREQTRSDIEVIKNRANIVDTVSEFVPLKKAGRNYIGLCPFHSEKTPSFTVSAEKQIFYCFGCGAGGDIFAFLEKINNMTFPEALEHLAAKTGVVLSEKKPGSADGERRLRDEILRLNELATEFFSRNLAAETGKGAREYLRKRGIGDAVIREFRLGLALNGWRTLRDFLEREKVPLKTAEKAGLIVRSDRGDYYDRFRGRLIFPIEGLNDRVIAFGGRAPGDEKPKYLNSPESPVYVKGRNLYALNKTREEIRKKGFVVLVEGYFDALALWNAGIRNVAATLGTALTKEHLTVIRRFADRVVVTFDPDEGGRSGLERSLRLFLEEKFDAKIVVLPDSCDPDDYIKKYGPEKMNGLISDAKSMADYYIENVIGRNGKGFEGELKVVRNAVPFIGRINDVIERNLFTKRVSELLGIDQNLLKTEVSRTVGRKERNVVVGMSPAKATEDADRIELDLIHMLLEYPHKIAAALESGVFRYFENPLLRGLEAALEENYRKRGVINISDFTEGIGDDALKERILKRSLSDRSYGSEMVDKLFSDFVRKIKSRWFRLRHRELKMELVKAQEKGDSALCRRILMEKEDLLKKQKES
ncbi:MAG: DNA primase [Syntrophales bacterium]